MEPGRQRRRLATILIALGAATAFLGVIAAEVGAAEACPPGEWTDGIGAGDYPSYSVDCAGPADAKHIFGNGQVNVVGDRTGAVYLAETSRGAAVFGRRVGAGYSAVTFEGSGDVLVTGGPAATAGDKSQRFGVDDLETSTADETLEVVHHVQTPPAAAPGDPVVTDTVTIRNTTGSEVVFTHHEIWDASYTALSSPSEWVRPLRRSLRGFTAVQDLFRDIFSASFTPQVRADGSSATVHREWSGQAWKKTAPAQRSTDNFYVQDFSVQAASDAVAFGSGGLPEGLARLRGARNQPVLLGVSDHVLGPGATATLGFDVFLTPHADAPEPDLDTLPSIQPAVTPPRAGCIDALGPAQCEVLAREFRWKTGQLQSWALRRDYYGKYAPPQGSVYFYLQGWDGAPRDLHQQVPVLARTNPDLARQVLELTMSLQISNDDPGPASAADGPGNVSYSFHGYGCAGDVPPECKNLIGPSDFGVRSDLDQYFIWATLAYASALDPGELDRWLTESDVDFYPKGTRPSTVAGTTALDHLRAAFYHLRDSVGLGPHGLVRLREGDWNDAALTLFFYNGHIMIGADQSEAESVPASQMALSVLPDLADIVRAYDPAIAAEMEAFAAQLAPALRAVYNASGHEPWFARAWMRDILGEWVLVEAEHINLHAQVWSLQNDNFAEYGVLSEAEQIALLELIHERLDAPSPIGAPVVSRDFHLGFSQTLPYGRTALLSWSSIRSLLTQAYARFADTRAYAWDALWRTSYANYAQWNPDTWVGVLSGPDSFNLVKAFGPAWDFIILAMNEFPYANSNPNANWSWALWQTGSAE